METVLVVGLGNPGPKYQFTRHNMGFIALDWFSERKNLANSWKSESDCDLLVLELFKKKVFFAKPMTFMNLSGQCVRRIMQFYKIDVTNLLVLQDDLDLDLGVLKFQKARGAGGNNGIKSIHEELGHNDYARLKMGIGRPPHPNFEISDWVLSRFSKSDEDSLKMICDNATLAIEMFIEFGFGKAASLLPARSKGISS